VPERASGNLGNPATGALKAWQSEHYICPASSSGNGFPPAQLPATNIPGGELVLLVVSLLTHSTSLHTKSAVRMHWPLSCCALQVWCARRRAYVGRRGQRRHDPSRVRFVKCGWLGVPGLPGGCEAAGSGLALRRPHALRDRAERQRVHGARALAQRTPCRICRSDVERCC